MIISENEPIAASVSEAIHTGDIPRLQKLLTDYPELAAARIVGGDGRNDKVSRTLLHVASDWPGHFPNGIDSVAVLIKAGAAVNARIVGPSAETPSIGLQAAVILRCSMLLSMPAQILKHPAQSSPAVRRWTTQ